MAARQQPKTSAGMVARHFDHPSGAKATLESPAGWSNSTFYRLTIWDKDGDQQDPEIKSFNTAAEARAGAIARERDALTSGWRPRMAAGATQPDEQVTVFTEGGQPINCRVKHASFDVTRIGNMNLGGDFGDERPRMLAITMLVSVRSGQQNQFDNLGRLFLIRRRSGDVTLVCQAALRHVEGRPSSRAAERGWLDYHLELEGAPNDGGLNEIIERGETREAIIASAIEDGHDASISGLWLFLTERAQDSSERQNLCQEIMSRRADREAQARRTEETEAERQREAARQAARDQAYRQQRERAIRQRQLPMVPEKDEAETLRKLSGGKELGKPKKRKIDLGD